MSIRMKGLTTFQGREGLVHRGHEIVVDNERRAEYLEKKRLAVRIPVDGKPEVNTKTPKPNEAATVGPLSSVGSKTGEVKTAPLSGVARVRPPRKSRSRKGGAK